MYHSVLPCVIPCNCIILYYFVLLCFIRCHCIIQYYSFTQFSCITVCHLFCCRTKLRSYQVEITLDPDSSHYKTKPQFLKRRSVPKLGAECDPCEKTVTVNSDSVRHVKLGHGALTRRQSSGNDLVSVAKTGPGGASRALTRRQSGGRQDLLGVDKRRNSFGKERRGSLRLKEVEKERTRCVARLGAITLDQCSTEFERSALLCHNKYRVRHGVPLLQLDRKVGIIQGDTKGAVQINCGFLNQNQRHFGFIEIFEIKQTNIL